MLQNRLIGYIDYSGITRSRLAARLGISYHYLWLWLSGRCDISDSLKKRIEDYLNEYYRE